MEVQKCCRSLTLPALQSSGSDNLMRHCLWRLGRPGDERLVLQEKGYEIWLDPTIGICSRQTPRDDCAVRNFAAAFSCCAEHCKCFYSYSNPHHRKASSLTPILIRPFHSGRTKRFRLGWQFGLFTNWSVNYHKMNQNDRKYHKMT